MRDLDQKRSAIEDQEHQLQTQTERKRELAGVSASVEEFCQRVESGLVNATFEQKRVLVDESYPKLDGRKSSPPFHSSANPCRIL